MVVSLPYYAFFGGMSCTRVDRYRVSHPVSCTVGGSGSGVRDYVVLGIGGTRVRSSVCQTTLTVTNRLKVRAGASASGRAKTARSASACNGGNIAWDNLEHGQPLADHGRSSEVQDGCQALERRQLLRANG